MLKSEANRFFGAPSGRFPSVVFKLELRDAWMSSSALKKASDGFSDVSEIVRWTSRRVTSSQIFGLSECSESDCNGWDDCGADFDNISTSSSLCEFFRKSNSPRENCCRASWCFCCVFGLESNKRYGTSCACLKWKLIQLKQFEFRINLSSEMSVASYKIIRTCWMISPVAYRITIGLIVRCAFEFRNVQRTELLKLTS